MIYENVILITDYDGLTNEDTDSFWSQGVNLDDWDYMVLIPFSSDLVLSKDDPSDMSDSNYTNDFNLNRMLSSNYNYCNCWYPYIEFRGNRYFVGVNYHG